MSLIDDFLPDYQFCERHHTMIRCDTGRLLDLIQSYQPPRDRIVDTAMWLRQLPARLLHRAMPTRIAAPQPFTRATFVPLARDGDREILAGLVGRFWRPDFGLVAIDGPEAFRACKLRRTARLVLSFQAEEIGEATRLTTETRVHCPDAYALMMFYPYWLIIRPVSGVLRRRALAAIRSLAETECPLRARPSGE